MLDLEAIEARANAATKGPWETNEGRYGEKKYDLCIGNEDDEYRCNVVNAGFEGDGGVDQPDADFIAHAREDIPELIHEVRVLRALLAQR